jgi:hypothetical protein
VGRRREPRKKTEMPVRIFGTDSSGRVFSEKATTVNVSWQGIELSGVEPRLSVDEIIGLTYGKNRVHFRVKWVGQTGTPKEGHVGLCPVAYRRKLIARCLISCRSEANCVNSSGLLGHRHQSVSTS